MKMWRQFLRLHCLEQIFPSPNRSLCSSTLSLGKKTLLKKHNESMRQLSRRRRYRDSLRLYESLYRNSIEPNADTYNIVLSIYKETAQPDLALKTLRRMSRNGISPNETTYKASIPALAHLKTIGSDEYCADVYDAALSVYQKVGKYQQVLAVYNIMKTNGVQPSQKSYETIILACDKSGAHNTLLAVLDNMLAAGITISANIYRVVVVAFEKAGKHTEASKLLENMPHDYVKENTNPDIVTYNALIYSAVNAGKYELTIELLQDMIEKGVEPSVISYNAAILACDKAGKGILALDLLRDMGNRNITPEADTYSGAILALWSAGRYELACDLFEMLMTVLEQQGSHRLCLELLNDMRMKGISPKSLLYTAVLSASNDDGKYSHDLELLRKMRIRGTKVDLSSYSAAISVCEKHNNIDESTRLLKEAIHEGVLDISIFTKKENGVSVLDLHGYSVGLSKALVRYFIQRKRRQKRKHQPMSVYVITGKGNHVNEDGKRGILRSEINHFIKTHLRLEVMPRFRNAGCLVVSL